jgi:predicted permease
MIDVLALVLPFFALILTGYAIARAAPQPVEALGWLNTLVVYVALPALFFQLLARTPFERLSEWSFILGSVASTFVVFLLMFGFSFVASRGEIRESTIKGLASAYGNIGYMGPALTITALGPEAAVPVALIFCFENVMHITLVPLLMAVAARDGSSPGKLAAIAARRIALHPFIIATALGVLAAYLRFDPPGPVERYLSWFAGAAAPCALFAMGVTLALRPVRRVPREMGLIVLLKLVLHPLLCYVTLSAIGDFPPNWLLAAVLLAALPTATSVFVVAQQYGVWVERASASVLITTLGSVPTITGLIYLMRGGFLPPDLFP